MIVSTGSKRLITLMFCLVLVACGGASPTATDVSVSRVTRVPTAGPTHETVPAPTATTLAQRARLNSRGTPQVGGSGFLINDSPDIGFKAFFFQYSENNGAIEGIVLYPDYNGTDSYEQFDGTRGSNVPGANATLKFRSSSFSGELPVYLGPEKVVLFFRDSSTNSYRQVALRPATFTDYQRAIQAAATPATTSSAASCGRPSSDSSARSVAESFLRAALAEDLSCARQQFAPDKQPKSWVAIMGGQDANEYNKTAYPSNVAECKGTSYTVVERQGQFGGVPYNEVAFVFARPCVVKYSPAPLKWDPPKSTTSDTVAVSVERSTGTWYVDAVSIR